VDDYWRKVYLYGPIANRIARDRYREISRYLHYVDNTTLAPRGSQTYDQIGKVCPLLQSRFAEVYNPGRELAVDEAMISFRA
jgi:hypothetical protein